MYQPLNPRKNEIRILKLLPGPFESHIQCQLAVESTEAKFEALSYVWGDPYYKKGIEIEEQSIEVTQNLESALRHLRHENEIRRLWVDAVCINQNDDGERNHQVGLMSDIYKGAESVVVWLGLESFEVENLEAIRRLGSDPDLHWDPANNPDTDSFLSDASMLRLLFWFRNPWYTRIWTLQEAILAKSLVYVCGSFVFCNGEIDGFVKSFLHHCMAKRCCDIDSQLIRNHVAGMKRELSQSLERLRNMAQLHEKDGPSSFLEVASRFRHRLATDPRDQVFGLLGLTNDLPKKVIDYGLPVSEVYTNTAFELIAATGNLDVLSHVLPKPTKGGRERAVYPRSVQLDLPSWVPNWSDHRVDGNWRLLGLTSRQSYAELFNACQAGSVATPTRPSLISLSLEGFLCDELAELGQKMDLKNGLFDGKALMESRMMAKVDSNPEQPYIAGSTMFDAYWRTVCMNVDPLNTTSDAPKKADLGTRALHDKWWWALLLRYKYGRETEEPPKNDAPIIDMFAQHIVGLMSGRKFFISKRGFIGFAPEDAREGDLIWVLRGGRLPIILRRLEPQSAQSSDAEYTLVGDSYVHGIMDGEVVEKARREGTVAQRVVLV